jgi:hypothetical protein
VTEIDWPRWTSVDRTTLLFVVAGGRILLIRKKRGLGAGKINGPGGRIEDGESALAGGTSAARCRAVYSSSPNHEARPSRCSRLLHIQYPSSPGSAGSSA